MATGQMPQNAFWKDDSYFVLDQLLLPHQTVYIECRTPEDVEATIKNMNLRGAPLIGAAASAGTALYFRGNTPPAYSFDEMISKLLSTRPTAVNLRNVLDESKNLYMQNCTKNRNELFKIFHDFSEQVHARDAVRCAKMGEIGAGFVKERIYKGKKLKILTHCNAGALATCGSGTALSVIRALNRLNLVEKVWVDETRPYLQGARLTAFEMLCEGIPHEIITDSTAGWLMHENEVDFIIIGADRVAANGDLANKIGSYYLSVLANFHKIPFISAMPLETFDLSIPDGKSIVIEKRSDSELLSLNGIRIAHERCRGLHLGFDVVPAELLFALVTENGVVSDGISADKITQLFK